MPTIEQTINGIIFEWDTDKYELVLNNHGVQFEEAISVFFDPNELSYEDTRGYEEVRYITIGMSHQGRLLFVSWTQRATNIRLITAFKAEKSHQRSYANANR
ncbi:MULTISPECIES: BrnT family toxin [unclassified Moraxella]|uniref:BrnT family toxin n=1 Tax=unclassified Moraxella TaxID=2685852 RepID=UPI003AF48F51